MIQNNRVLLIDGFNNWLRFYLVDKSMNVSGDLYGGAMGFIRSLAFYVRLFKPTSVIVAWEQGGGSLRRRSLYSEYKANRAHDKQLFKEVAKNGYASERTQLMADSETKKQQLLFLTKVLGQLPVNQIYVQDTEADDIIAYLVKHKFKDCEKIILSSDRDYYQLLSVPDTFIYEPIRRIKIDKKYVLDKFGIMAENFCLAKTIIGDDSDNINGVGGIGFKTFVKCFNDVNVKEYGTITEFIDKAKELSATSKRKAYKDIVLNEEIIKRNWQLMYLDINMLAATHIEKIESRLESFKPTCNRLEFLKLFLKNNLSVSEELDRVPSDLMYLTRVTQ